MVIHNGLQSFAAIRNDLLSFAIICSRLQSFTVIRNHCQSFAATRNDLHSFATICSHLQNLVLYLRTCLSAHLPIWPFAYLPPSPPVLSGKEPVVTTDDVKQQQERARKETERTKEILGARGETGGNVGTVWQKEREKEEGEEEERLRASKKAADAAVYVLCSWRANGDRGSTCRGARAVRSRCGYWACPTDPFIQSQSGGMVTPQSLPGTIYNSSPGRPSPGEVVRKPDAVQILPRSDKCPQTRKSCDPPRPSIEHLCQPPPLSGSLRRPGVCT